MKVSSQVRSSNLPFYTNNASPNLQGLVNKNQAIDLNENNQLDTVPLGQRYWTGVWKHRARERELRMITNGSTLAQKS